MITLLRRTLGGLVVCMGLLALSTTVQGQEAGDSPGKPIRTTVTYAPIITLDPQTRAITSCGLQMTVLRDDVPLISTALEQRRHGDLTRVTWCSIPRTLLHENPLTGMAALDVRGALRLETPVALPAASRKRAARP